MPLSPGTELGPYTVRALIGRGGMGEVYLADDTRLGRRVAVKRPTGERADDPQSRARLLREARAAASLNHPNIAAIYDVLEADLSDGAGHSSPFIVMEYVAGESLADRVARGPVPVPALLRIALQICDGLAHAHAAGMVHRDIKPANLRVTDDGRVKILDFGLAKASSSGARPAPSLDTVTASAHVAGSPGYMSPEQWFGAAVDARSDIYSLGVVFFEMATGRRPPASSPLDALASPAAAPGIPGSADAVPAALSDVIGRATAQRASDRFQSVAELRAALAALDAEEQQQTTRLSDAGTHVDTRAVAPAGWMSTLTRHRRAIGAVALVLVAVGSLLGWQAWRGRPGPAAPAARAAGRPVIAVMAMENLSGDASKRYLGIGVADTVATTLSRIRGVTVVPGGATDTGRLDAARAAKVAHDVGATYLVDGGVQQSGDRIKVSARLLRPDGSIAWGKVYDGLLSDFFALQGQLAESVSAVVEVTLSAAERERVSATQTRSPEALAAYWKGRTALDSSGGGAPQVSVAVAEFKAAVDADNEFALAHAGLGQAYWRQYQETKESRWIEMAVGEAQTALRLDPERTQVAVSLATIYNGTGRAREAIEVLQEAVRRQGNDDQAHLLLGEILAAQGRTEEGIAELRRAIALRPDFWRHHTRLGLALYRVGRFPEAISELRHATELQPDSPVAFHMLGTVYQATGDNEQALRNYTRVTELGPTAQTYYNIGVIHYDAARYKQAAEALERAVALKPNEAQNHRTLGDAYSRLGNRSRANASYARAAQLAQRDLEVNPRDARSMSLLAVCEAKLGRAAAARRHADAAVELAPTQADVLYRQAIVYGLSGRAPRALDALQSAISRGYSAALAQKDDDLAPLRRLPAFAKVVGQSR